MTAEAKLRQRGDTLDYTAVAAMTAGQVIQLADGRAGIVQNDIAAGDLGAVAVSGVFRVLKSADVVIIDGAPITWDHSANSATPIPAQMSSDKDFFLGSAVGDFAAASAYLDVALNQKPEYVIDVFRDAGDTVVVLTAGTPYLTQRGGMLEAGFSATAEAQKLDWLSKRSVPIAANPVLEAIVEVVTTCDADVGDLTIGLANGTHASDFQSVTEFVAVHLDLGADLNIDAESDDGTTDVAPTDTTLDFAEGTRFHIAIDCRNPADCQIYINGVLVLGSTTFTLAAATGPLKAIFHLEKSSNDSPGVVQLDMLKVRIAEQ